MRFSKKVLFACLILGGLLGLLVVPVATRQATNFQVTTRRIPWVVKWTEFLLRDYEYRDLANRLTRGLTTEEMKANALLLWTHDHIRPAPPEWPVVDDHISHIIIRGYGEEDQMADVFTTLATYSGIPSFWRPIRSSALPGADWVAILSFAKIRGRWTAWHVAGGVPFRDPAGKLPSVEQLASNPEMLQFTLGSLPSLDGQYLPLIREALAHFTVPETLRAEKQMPIPRVFFEFREAGRRLCRGR